MKSSNQDWSDKDVKETTRSFIDYLDKHYHQAYYRDALRYERIHDALFVGSVGLGFLVTVLVGANEIFSPLKLDPLVKFAIFFLPSLSSFLAIYSSRKGFKKKMELRESARIRMKYLINEAKIRFVAAKNKEDYLSLYHWLNAETQVIQEAQASGYYKVHNREERYEKA